MLLEEELRMLILEQPSKELVNEIPVTFVVAIPAPFAKTVSLSSNLGPALKPFNNTLAPISRSGSAPRSEI
jgi:hypothetical protein